MILAIATFVNQRFHVGAISHQVLLDSGGSNIDVV
eukprot:SAG22_NODE_18573_length_285_cov_0.666667_1_plen_34_part_01